MKSVWFKPIINQQKFKLNRPVKMGANDSKLFKQGEPISNYQIIQKIPEQSVTYLSHKTTGKSYLLKQFAYNDKKQFTTNCEKFKVRKSLACEHLTKLQRVEQKFQDQLCSTFFKIFTMWEYPLNNLSQQINRRAIDKKYFQEKQIWSILACTIIGMNCLQTASIKHQCLSTKTILLDQKTSSVKIADPLTCATQNNFDLINANRRLKTIYLSPQQCQSLKNQRPIPNRNPYKSDVFTMGMILLECGLVQRVDDVYRQQCQEISYQTIDKKLDLFQKRYSEDLRSIIQLMLNRDPKERPCWNELNQYVPKNKEEGIQKNSGNNKTVVNQQSGMQFYRNSQPQTTNNVQAYKFRPLGTTVGLSSNNNSTAPLVNINNNQPLPLNINKNANNSTLNSNNKFANVQLGGTTPSNNTFTTFNPTGTSQNYNNYSSSYNYQPTVVKQTTQQNSTFNTNFSNFGTFGTISNNNYITSQPISTGSYVPQNQINKTNININTYKPQQKYNITTQPITGFEYPKNQFNSQLPFQMNTALVKTPHQPYVSNVVGVDYKPVQVLKQNKQYFDTKQYFKSYADNSYKIGQNQPNYTSYIPTYNRPVSTQAQLKPLNRIESNLINKSPQTDAKIVQNNITHTTPFISNYVKDATSITYQKNMYNSYLDSNYQKSITNHNNDAKTTIGNQVWKQNSSNQNWKQPINTQPWKQPINTQPWKQAISFETNPQQNYNYYAANNTNNTKNVNDFQTNNNNIDKKQTNYNNFNQFQPIKTTNYYTTNNNLYQPISNNNTNVPGPFSQNSNITNIQSKPNIQTLQYVIEHFKQGSRYEGTKLNDMRHGQGKFFYQDGGMYDGNWKFNKMDGYGKLYYQSGKIAYQGNWHDDQFQGFGKLFNQQSDPLQEEFQYENFDFIQEYWDYYQGNFVEDQKDGQGKLVFSNGQYFIGTFCRDMVEGPGKFYRKNGQIIDGIWNQNQLVEQN